MIWGYNFTGKPIPPNIEKAFPKTLKGKREHGERYLLKGVATTPQGRDAMLATASNGQRKLAVFERSDWKVVRYGPGEQGGMLYGVYVGW